MKLVIINNHLDLRDGEKIQNTAVSTNTTTAKIKLNHVTQNFIKETKISKKLFYKVIYFAYSQNILLT